MGRTPEDIVGRRQAAMEDFTTASHQLGQAQHVVTVAAGEIGALERIRDDLVARLAKARASGYDERGQEAALQAGIDQTAGEITRQSARRDEALALVQTASGDRADAVQLLHEIEVDVQSGA